ncbi:MAG: HEAT repeat domain-containing protein [Acidobacteriota bacterium]
MTVNVDELRHTLGRVSARVASLCSTSLLFLMEHSGRTVGYAGRVAGSVCSTTKHLLGAGSKRSAGIFTGGLRKKYGLTKSEVQAKLTLIDTRVRELYLEIGKMGSGSDDVAGILATAEAESVIEKIKALEDESSALNKYLAELEAAERQGLPITKFTVKPKSAIDGARFKKMSAVAEASIRKATFTLKSDAIIFQKALRDLLEADMDIKRLAVSELGKMGNKHAGPVLKEAIGIDNHDLQAEILNALIQIDDPDVVAICKRHMNHPYAGVRAACVRGLYRVGKTDTAPLLVEALKDDNVEVRNSSAMFLGWLEFTPAIPTLLHVAAADLDVRVRKSALQALENIRDQGAVLPLMRLLNDDDKDIRDKVLVTLERITGESLAIDTSDDARARVAAVSRVKEWWIRKKHDIANPDDAPAAEASDVAAAEFAPAAESAPADASDAAGTAGADATAPHSGLDEPDGSAEVGKRRPRRR